jgi:pyridoxamine 5'-phosphate oxidase
MSDINHTLQNLRVSYLSASLDVADCDHNPEKQFTLWFNQALETKCDEPNAFVLSTVKGDQPRARVVLLKGIQSDRFLFFTNYESAKGHEIENNQKVSMTFLWLPLQRQVRIEGVLTKVSASDSDEYFKKRPRGSQLGAIASPQSEMMGSRASLEELFKKAEAAYAQDLSLPRPAHWGGYGIAPTYFEFWQGRDNRMHDRIVYQKKESQWVLSRLAP